MEGVKESPAGTHGDLIQQSADFLPRTTGLSTVNIVNNYGKTG